MKRAFTLIELLVVIGIIGILGGIMLASFSGSTESARAAQCLSNMRNLAAACQTFGSKEGYYPPAGSMEYNEIDEAQGMSKAKTVYHERPGWISWASHGVYASKPNSKKASQSWMTSAYSSDEKESLYCLTNGALWKYVSGNRQTYVCKEHVKRHPKNPPYWSYVMNAYFGWEWGGGRKWYGELQRADRILLFAELQFMPCSLPISDGGGANEACDTVLQYSPPADSAEKGQNGSSGSELIGVNHKNGRNLFAHVAFADGHVEKLTIPFTGSIKKPQIDSSMLRDLTGWLCTGKDVSFDGKRYEQMDN